jgi:hypothetical protein
MEWQQQQVVQEEMVVQQEVPDWAVQQVVQQVPIMQVADGVAHHNPKVKKSWPEVVGKRTGKRRIHSRSQGAGGEVVLR